MKRLTLWVNVTLVAIIMAAPFALAHGWAKQERIEIARRGQ